MAWSAPRGVPVQATSLGLLFVLGCAILHCGGGKSAGSAGPGGSGLTGGDAAASGVVGAAAGDAASDALAQAPSQDAGLGALGDAATGDSSLTDGATGCEATAGDGSACFQTGLWEIDNLEPCILSFTDDAGSTVNLAYASTPGTPPTCPIDFNTGTPVVPASWSTDTLTVDCAGSYFLCFTVQAGDPGNPQPSDCVLAKVCTATAPYMMPGAPQTFPPLPGWQTTPAQSDCVEQFEQSGGTGVMSVVGQSDECQLVARDFQNFTYCPTSCGSAGAPPSCETCASGGGGSF